MADRIQPRRDTAARWAAANPVLLEGEWGVVTDSPSQYKIGDGVTPWNSLPLRGYDGTLVQTTGNGTQTVMSQEATTKALAAQKNYTDTKAKEVADNLSAAEQRIEGEIGELRQEAADTYATKTGEYKELTAGFAYEILGDGQVTAEKFSFRPTGGLNRNVRDGSARIEVLKGNSVVCNQIVKVDSILPSSQTINGVTFTNIGNGRISVSTDANGATAQTSLTLGEGIGALNHKLLYAGAPIGASPTTCIMYNPWMGLPVNNTIINSTSDNFAYVLRVPAGAVITTPLVFTPICTNLTKMFGADIANNITKLEQFYELLPEGVDINAYNGGEIVDANYKAVKTTGFNQWDEQWELGTISSADGLPIVSDSIIRSKNFTKVLPVKYCVSTSNNTLTSVQVFYYDESKKYVSNAWVETQREFSAPDGTNYIKFRLGTDYGTTYNNDICINIAWDEYSALNGTYKPYKPFERDLSLVAKYFPNGMRSAGNVADEIRFNSTTQQWEAVQRVGVVDLGSLTWTTDAVGDKIGFVCRQSVVTPPKDIYSKPNMLCAPFVTVTQANNNSYENDKVIFANVNGWLLVSAWKFNGDASAFKSAMDGVMLNYELATPIVTPITEDINLAYDVADYGTEQLIVAEGAQSAPLSAEIVYENNASMLLKQIAPALDRLDAVEAILATMQASAVATTNEE